MGIAVLCGILDSITPPEGMNGTLKRSLVGQTATPLPIPKLSRRIPNKFIACVKRDESARKLQKLFNSERVEVLCRENVRGAKAARLILIASKPNMVKEILTEQGMKAALAGKVLITIAKGVTIAQMRAWCPDSTHIVRAMPNVACKVPSGGYCI